MNDNITASNDGNDLLNGFHLNVMSVAEIDFLIMQGELTEEDVEHYYNNSQWRDAL